MTANKSSQRLADALRTAGLKALARRAEADEFHDFDSPHVFPELMLADILIREAAQNPAALEIRRRLIDGEFDATLEESDEWAASESGQAVLGELVKPTKGQA